MRNKEKTPLGELLRERRTARNLSLRDVEACGVSNAYLCQLENGRIKAPSPFILRKLAKLYECSFEEMLLAAKYIDSAIMKIKCSNCGHWTEIKCEKESALEMQLSRKSPTSSAKQSTKSKKEK